MKTKLSRAGILTRMGGLAMLLLAGSTASALEVTHRYFRFTPTKLRNNAAANSVQLAEFELLNSAVLVDYTGLIVTNPGGDSPPMGAGDALTEDVTKLVDGDTFTKWLDFTKFSPVVFEFPAPVTIDSYTFATAGDAIERDPVSWTFEGSDDGVDWVLYDAVSDHPTTTLRNFYELDFFLPETLNPVIGSFTAYPIVVRNGETITLDWMTTLTDFVSIAPAPGEVDLNGMTMVTPPDNADTTYTLTATNGDEELTSELTVRAVQGGTATYQYFRFTPTKFVGAGAENSIQLAEFEMLFEGVKLPGATATNPEGDNPTEEIPAYAVDGNANTKWLDFNKGALVLAFGAPVAADGYRFITANDAPARDPIEWILEGSDSIDGPWTLIENFQGLDVTPDDRFTATQDLPLPGASITPYVRFFTGDSPALVTGNPLVLSWEIAGATEASIEGIGVVPITGSTTVNPTEATTYMIAASSIGGMVEAEFSMDLIDPLIDVIDYDDFDMAGDELGVYGSALVLNDFANVPLPRDANRLRLTAAAGQNGIAWFRHRQNVAAGFETTFDMQFLDPLNGGADGLSFMIQNHPAGSGAIPPKGEEGLISNCVTIKFDSFYNANGIELTSGTFVALKSGNDVLTQTNLVGLVGLAGPSDLAGPAATTSPYLVRVIYVPGDLDVYVDNTLVIDSYNIDLMAEGATDASGTAWVGFGGRTGDSSEIHDITMWKLTTGVPEVELELLDISYAKDTNMLSLTWSSSDTKTYRIARSTDGLDFSGSVLTGISGTPGGISTTQSFIITEPTELFRVEEE